jgi:hypothetical protein
LGEVLLAIRDTDEVFRVASFLTAFMADGRAFFCPVAPLLQQSTLLLQHN